MCPLMSRSCCTQAGRMQSLSGHLWEIVSHRARELIASRPRAYLRIHTAVIQAERYALEYDTVGQTGRHHGHKIQRRGVGWDSWCTLSFAVSNALLGGGMMSLSSFTLNGQPQLGTTPQVWDYESKLI